MLISEVISENNNPQYLLHGSPNNNLTLNAIQLFNPQAKQNKKGRVYGGFYTTDPSDIIQAKKYATPTGSIYKIFIHPNAKIITKNGDITRLSQNTIEEYKNSGYDIVKGKDPRGYSEYAIINLDIITDITKLPNLTEVRANLIKKYDPDSDQTEIGAKVDFTDIHKEKVYQIPLNQIKSRWEGDDKADPQYSDSRNNIENIKKQIKRDISKIPPIIVRRLPKQNTFQVIDGHHRYFAFRELNIKKIPTIILNANQITGHKFTESTITLNDLYDYDELNDESETLYHWTTPEDYDKKYEIKIMQPNQLKNITTPNGDITVLDAYKQFADKNQKQLVKSKAKNFDHNRIIVIANNTIIDGNHHTIAAILTNNPVKYIDIYDE